jgi:NADH dehydrogenase/NADH:ubiquinone oxidoreductase subunit G
LAERLAATDNAGIGKPPTGAGAAPAGGGLPTLAAATTPADAAAELKAIKASQSPSVPTEIASALDEVGAAKRTAIDAEEAQRQKDIAAMGTAFSDREARLKEKQGRVDQQERDLTPMALMQAGFAMMSGTSPHALSNIGAGATIGLKTYQEGLDKIENAKDKLDDAFGRIEEFRRNESMMNAKDKRKYARELSDTFTDTKKAYTDVLVKDWGVKQDDARILYSSVVAERRELNNQRFQAGENALNRANALAQTTLQAKLRQDPLALYREMGTNPTGAVAKGYGAAKEENTAPTLFGQYQTLSKDLVNGDAFKKMYPTAESYIKAYRAAMGQDTMPKTGVAGFKYLGPD